MPKLANKPVIAVDIDDVLASSALEFVNFSNKTWGTNLTIDDYDEHWARMWKLDDAETFVRIDVIKNSKLPLRYPHRSESLQVLRKLSRDYKLVVATSRNKTAHGMTLEWVNKNFADIFDEIHFSGLWDKDTDLDSMNKLTKAELCKQIGADYLIDDQPKHCIAAAASGVTSLLFGDYKWNRTTKIANNMVRVKNWQEVLDYFENEKSR